MTPSIETLKRKTGAGKPPNPKRNEIRSAYLAGERKCEISERLGVSIKVVVWNTRDLPPAAVINPPRGKALPLGKFGLKENLTYEQLLKLDDLARKWGCGTRGEAAIEILRDALEEMG